MFCRGGCSCSNFWWGSGFVSSTACFFCMCVQHGDRLWQQALHLFHVMPQKDVTPNTINFNATISSCSSQWRWALHLFHAMPLAKVPRDVISYNATLNSFLVWTTLFCMSCISSFTAWFSHSEHSGRLRRMSLEFLRFKRLSSNLSSLDPPWTRNWFFEVFHFCHH